MSQNYNTTMEATLTLIQTPNMGVSAPKLGRALGAIKEAGSKWASRVLCSLEWDAPTITINDALSLLALCGNMRVEFQLDARAHGKDYNRAVSRDMRRIMMELRTATEPHGVEFQWDAGILFTSTLSDRRDQEDLRVQHAERFYRVEVPASRGLEVRFYGPTNTRGSRIGIIDHDRGERVELSRDYRFNSIMAQATDWLHQRGFSITGALEQTGTAPNYLMTETYDLGLKA
jgi:hypothetical protein